MTSDTGTHGHHSNHGHQHGRHDHDFDWEEMAELLEREAELHSGYLKEAAGWLRDGLLHGPEAPGTVSRVLDVGSGPGVVTALLARYFPDAETVAVDGTPELLERVRARAASLGLEERVRTHHAELPDGLGTLETLGGAELIWASQTVHHIGDQQAALDGLARALRPGGLLAVAERGLSRRSLPRDIGIGRPGLEARLEAALEDWFTGMRDELPGSVRVVEDWPGMLARAGLTPAGSRSFVIDLPAPLDARAREHVHATMSRFRDGVGDGLSSEDNRTLDALLDADAETGILRRPDAFYLSTITVHTARAPQ
ncbi:methyltransferase domain-containing protein [Streptomyces sp. N2-109]|uniref:Methyltransferase domain-containing protein n=1 Tax=Streptomyces gossypii TaxID=2883101 RepID=A0ABT2JX80_9ACTN|nr:class I SAM-dependent methyltransferase [Streptomyces gossypii]MCT2592508.1 methyltransferase domain-containing protein [Streptomyces gossypii]